MLDRDLAALYGVETKNLNKAVRRNLDRFPADFMSLLPAEGAGCSRFQFGTLKRGQHINCRPQDRSRQHAKTLEPGQQWKCTFGPSKRELIEQQR